MKKVKNFAVALISGSAVLLGAASSPAYATPSITPQVHSSGVSISADNPGTKTYACQVSFQYEYDSFGTRKSGTINELAYAPSGKSTIFRLQGWFVNLSVVNGGPYVTCH